MVTGDQLKAKADRFHEEMDKKKSQKTKTKPQSPNFIKRPSRVLNRDYINEGESMRALQKEKQAAALRKLAASAKEGPAGEKNPVSTKAVQKTQEKRREEIQAKKKAEEDAKAEEAERIRRQNAMKGRV